MPRIYTEQELREGMAEIIKIATECELTWQEGKAEAMKGYLKDAMSLVKAACWLKGEREVPLLDFKGVSFQPSSEAMTIEARIAQLYYDSVDLYNRQMLGPVEFAGQILALGLMELDGDQELPKFSFSEEPPGMRFGWQEAMKAVEEDNFRRVKPQ